MVTSYDVARVAGVDQSTVSRALRNDRRISPATSLRVREAAERLGFVPSFQGRQLATGAAHRIGIVATELNNPFYMALFDPMHTALSAAGYRTALITEPTHTPIAFDDLVDGSMDGLILTNCRLASGLPAALRNRGVAAVTLNREVEPQAVDSCVADNAKGASLVAEQMLLAGHTRIAHIAGPANTSTGRDRATAFRRALARANHRLDSTLLIRGEFSFATGYRGLEELMRHNEPPTAVFCANDVLAFGAYNAAAELGLTVPDDLSIVGFDDIPMSSWKLIELDTVRCNLARMAETAVQLLLSRIATPDLPLRRAILDPEYVSRASLARPRR
jgi:LacI family transcriptional regulator